MIDCVYNKLTMCASLVSSSLPVVSMLEVEALVSLLLNLKKDGKSLQEDRRFNWSSRVWCSFCDLQNIYKKIFYI